MTNITSGDKYIFEELKIAVNESDVQSTYRRLFKLALPQSNITSPTQTDGILVSPYIENPHKNLVAVLEFKYNRNFQNSEDDVISVLMQSLYYLKKLEKENTFPKVIFGADQNAGFCISTDVLQKYLHNENINWSFAPSSAYTNNPKLANKLKNDTEIIPHHFVINENFKFSDIILKMFNLDEGNIIKVPVTINNIDAVFKEFNENVLKEKNLTTHQEVSIFMNILLDTDKEHNYIREDKSILITSVDGIDKVKINDKRYKSFFTHYQTEYTLKEQNELAKSYDRLIEDESRRREGAFFTPTIWVNEAHAQITAQLGANWKNEYVVWDCCSGTGNLTRDCTGDNAFRELYSSTLLHEELDVAEVNNVNPEATHFQHDFLDKSKESLEALRGETSGSQNVNGYFDTDIQEEKSHLPSGLQTALEENKPIVFFMNPPFGAPGVMNNKNYDVEIAESTIKKLMKENGMGNPANQLSAQFLYRILMYKEQYNLSNIIIATFAPPVFLTGDSFKKFRNKLLNNFEYKSGMIFKANAFADITSEWPITFTIWKNGKNENDFNMDLKDINVDSSIRTIGTKTLYNMDNKKTATPWAKEEVKGIKKNKSVIQVKSALNPSGKCANIIDESIGYFQVGRNSVRSNDGPIGLYSTICNHPYGPSVILSNYKKCIALFTAKRTITEDWINQNDGYYVPNTTHPHYEQWNNDAIVYSLFNTSSQQSSLRNIQHDNKSHDIKNEFFWLSKDHMLKLGETHYYDALQHDVANDHERFIYTQLQNTSLSPDAQQVLDKATELLDKSFEYRKEFNETPTKLGTDKNLQCWDAGWYQIKLILKEYLPEDLVTFNKLYANFETRMREGVYEFGFLRR